MPTDRGILLYRRKIRQLIRDLTDGKKIPQPQQIPGEAVRTNGLTEIVLTKLDILSGFEEIPICYAYKIKNKIITEMPASLSDFRNAKPIYKNLKGWGELTPDMIEKELEGIF